MDMTKDVEVKGRRYRIGRMSARTGSWILTRIMSNSLPGGMDEKVGAVGMAGRPAMAEEEFYAIQDHCLSVVALYEDDSPVALPIMANHQFLAKAKDLEFDLVSVASLTLHSLVFNISPFFTDGGLSQLMGSVQSLGSFPPPPQL